MIPVTAQEASVVTATLVTCLTCSSQQKPKKIKRSNSTYMSLFSVANLIITTTHTCCLCRHVMNHFSHARGLHRFFSDHTFMVLCLESIQPRDVLHAFMHCQKTYSITVITGTSYTIM